MFRKWRCQKQKRNSRENSSLQGRQPRLSCLAPADSSSVTWGMVFNFWGHCDSIGLDKEGVPPWFTVGTKKILPGAPVALSLLSAKAVSSLHSPDHLLTQLWNTETSALTGSFVISCPHLGGTKRGGDWNVNSYLLPVTTLHWESYGENPACSGKWHTPPIFTKSILNFDVSLTQTNLEWGQVNVAFSQDLSPIFYRNIRYPCW